MSLFWYALGLLALLLVPVLFGLALAAARWATASALGMRGVRFLFGGAIENPETASLGRRAVVVGAGLVATYLIPASLFTVALLVGGSEVLSTVVSVSPNQPAAEAGMATGDRVLSVGGTPVATWSELTEAIRVHTGEPVEIVVRRSSGDEPLTVTPRGPNNRGKIGISTVPEPQQPGAIVAVGMGLKLPAEQFVKLVTRRVVGEGGVAHEPVSDVSVRTRDSRVASAVQVEAVLFSNAWPIAAMVALMLVPRRRR